MKKKNCHRFSAQAEQRTNCTQKSQRIRCCGRVITEQEVNDELLRNGQGQGKRMANGQGQGQGKRMANGQGQGKRMANGQGQGKRMANGQGQCKRMENGQKQQN